MVINTSQPLISALGIITYPSMKTIPKTAFTSSIGKYEYLKVPFGLEQAPAYFQELMNKVLKDLSFAITYLDDIIIYSKTAEEDLKHFPQTLQCRTIYKIEQCHFFANEIQYLGHVLSIIGIKPLPSKTAAIKLMKPPNSAKQVRAFFGLVCYHKFIKSLA